jgi:hypothetical protein
MRRLALLLACFFVLSLFFTPALPAKDKPKTATSEKIRQDFSKFVEIPGAEKVRAEQCAQCHTDLSKATAGACTRCRKLRANSATGRAVCMSPRAGTVLSTKWSDLTWVWLSQLNRQYKIWRQS